MSAAKKMSSKQFPVERSGAGKSTSKGGKPDFRTASVTVTRVTTTKPRSESATRGRHKVTVSRVDPRAIWATWRVG